MTLPTPLQALIHDLAQIPEVEAILLAGSRTGNTTDEHSDHDFYIYSSLPVPVDARQAVFDRHGAQMEVNNTFWEPEDDGHLAEFPIELIYRPWAWLENEMERTVVRCEAWAGYTTCFWDNFIRSEILFDRTGRAGQLQQQYRVPYPALLKQRIIEKNLPLLKTQMPNYIDQVAKAAKREDVVSINHRIAAFLASYFDVLFAVNEMTHPGEKKLLRIVREQCKVVPAHFAEDVTGVCTLREPMDQVLFRLHRLAEEITLLCEAPVAHPVPG